MLERLRKSVWNERYLTVLLLQEILIMYHSFLVMRFSYGDYCQADSAFQNSFLLSIDHGELLYVFTIMLPLTAAVTCGNLYSDDLKAGTLELQLTRESYAAYIVKNIITAAVSAALLCLIPLIMNLIISLICFEPVNSMTHHYLYSPDYSRIFYPEYTLSYTRTFQPFLFTMILFAVYSAVSCTAAVFNFALSILTEWKSYYCNAVTFFAFFLFNLVTYPVGFKADVSFSFLSYMHGLDEQGSLAGLTASCLLFLLVSLVMISARSIRFRRKS